MADGGTDFACTTKTNADYSSSADDYIGIGSSSASLVVTGIGLFCGGPVTAIIGVGITAAGHYASAVTGSTFHSGEIEYNVKFWRSHHIPSTNTLHLADDPHKGASRGPGTHINPGGSTLADYSSKVRVGDTVTIGLRAVQKLSLETVGHWSEIEGHVTTQFTKPMADAAQVDWVSGESP